MRYRVHFEPVDYEGNRHDIESYIAIYPPSISKILPIDKDGFPIEQIKQQVE